MKMLELGMVDKKNIEEHALLSFEKAKDPDYAQIYMKMLELRVLDKKNIEEHASLSFEKANDNSYYAQIYMKMLELGMVGKKNIEEHASLSFENAKDNLYYARIYMNMLELRYVNSKDLPPEQVNKQIFQHYKNIIIQYPGLKNIVINHLHNPEILNTITILTQSRNAYQILTHPGCKKLLEQRLFYKNITQNDTTTYHRTLLDIYSKLLKTINDDDLTQDLKKYDQFLSKYGQYEDMEYFFVDSRRGKIRSIHDALEQYDRLDSIITSRTNKGYTTVAIFFKNILAQVGQSEVGYEEFNSFLTRYDDNILSTCKDIIDGQEITDPEFIQLYNHCMTLHQHKQLYNQYGNLRLLTKLQDIVDNRQALQTLSPLQHSSNLRDQQVYDYFRQGIFNPRSNSMLFIDLYQHPNKIWSMKDGHATTDIHTQLLPSHYTEHEHIDLSSDDLVHALIDGSIDQLNYFKAYQQHYIIDTDNTLLGTIEDFIKQSDKNSISNLIVNYNHTATQKGAASISYKKFHAQGLVSLSHDQKKYFIKQILKKTYPEKKLTVLTAIISAMNDPSSWFNGINCDKFADGNGKKVVQMMNPLSNEFTISKGQKMLVNSRITLNQQTNQLFESNKKTIESGNTLAISGLPDQYTITIDNVEAIGNHGLDAKLVQHIYQKFFADYIAKHPRGPKDIAINSKHIQCGANHNKIDITQGSQANTTVAAIPNSYTDNYGVNTGTIDLPKINPEQLHEKIAKVSGLHQLGPEDIRPVAQLEKKVYGSIGASAGYPSMRSEIIASLINTITKQRSNLSFVSYDQSMLKGYLLAYEHKDHVYISDRVAPDNSKTALQLGYALLSGLEGVDNSKPIICKARSSTSLPIINKLIEKKGRSYTESSQSIGKETFPILTIYRDPELSPPLQ